MKERIKQPQKKSTQKKMASQSIKFTKEKGIKFTELSSFL